MRLSDRAYADIERGTVNMRTGTLLQICSALQITPNEVFVRQATPEGLDQEEIFARLRKCSSHERQTAMGLLAVYLDSLGV